MEKNLYTPHLMKLDKITDEAPGIRTFRLSFIDQKIASEFSFKAGQFGEYSVFGEGECTFCIASPPTRKDYIECSFQVAGKVTGAMRDLNIGDTIGFRGPYGNWFPVDKMKGGNIVFIGMGIGLAPVRSVIWNCLDMRDQFKDITIIVGSRSADLLVFKRELDEWENMQDVNFIKTVDPGGNPEGWKHKVGFVPTVVKEAAPSAEDACAVICGPPIGIKFTLPVLEEIGFPPERIYTTLENRMKCGLGKCGRCNIGNVYVCKDGPVFTAKELQELPDEF
ncbi:MAG: FAD/NAD(P)-binding protein [bacterium]